LERAARVSAFFLTEDNKEKKAVLSLELNGLFAAFACRAGASGIGGFPSV